MQMERGNILNKHLFLKVSLKLKIDDYIFKN